MNITFHIMLQLMSHRSTSIASERQFLDDDATLRQVRLLASELHERVLMENPGLSKLNTYPRFTIQG
jgi:hypothetical protein